MTVTLKDVASAAGVSRATASRVLSGAQRNVDPDLARRVFEASAHLGYRVNPVARALRTKRIGMIGVLVPSLQNAYFSSLVEALSTEAGKGGGGVLVASSDDDPATEKDRILSFLDSAVEGLVVVPASRVKSGPAIAEAAQWIPVVQLDRFAQDVEVPYIGIDNRAAVHQMVDYLRGPGGYRRILFLGADEESSSGAERIRAFRERAEAADEVHVLPRFSVEAGHTAGLDLLGRSVLPDAVLCSADVIAVGLVSALQHHGVSVPRDVAVTGFDDTLLLEVMTPVLTTVALPWNEMVAAAVRLLEGGTGNGAGEGKFATTLKVRASTMRDEAPGLNVR